jgi:hypothetical protein
MPCKVVNQVQLCLPRNKTLTQIELKFKSKVEEDEEVAARKCRYNFQYQAERDISLHLVLQPDGLQILLYSFDTFKT